jgi:hypothetical protein
MGILTGFFGYKVHYISLLSNHRSVLDMYIYIVSHQLDTQLGAVTQKNFNYRESITLHSPSSTYTF